MAAKKRKPPVDLKAFLFDEGYRYSFLQALRLLRLLVLREIGDHASDIQPLTKIKVRPHLSLDFPATDIFSIEPDATGLDKFVMTVTFLGLYGSSSPLPPFYTEDLIFEELDNYSAARDFIDVVNSSLYPLLFKGWSKYQLWYNLYEDSNQSMIDKLFSLLGTKDFDLTDLGIDPFKLLRYIGLTTFSTRSAEALRNLLSDYLNEPSMRIYQCESRVVRIDEEQQCYLGGLQSYLGYNCHLGTVAIDRMSKFRVFVNPMNSEDCRRLFPGGDAHRAMGNLIDFYLDRPLIWDLVIRFNRDKIRPIYLGKTPWSSLGWDTWLYCTNKDPVNLDVVV
jgi:type VI secretion system protein ImpH